MNRSPRSLAIVNFVLYVLSLPILAVYVYMVYVDSLHELRVPAYIIAGLILISLVHISSALLACSFWAIHRSQTASRVPFMHSPPLTSTRN
ncbi:hypothetical protein DFH06DRAFT_653595 [Mycena polygramma]|nr:hypothetical protein DFH06DRAFT_653595 [Mycena polygramma]